MTIPFLVIYIGAQILILPEIRLDINRSIPDRQFSDGEIIPVTVTIRNNGATLLLVDITDMIPTGLILTDGNNRALLSLKKDAVFTLTYSLEVRRGYYTFNEVRVRVNNFFNLFKKEVSISLPTKLVVYPLKTPISHLTIKPKKALGFSGIIPSGTEGSGEIFLGVREYQHGDPLKSINWKLTAKNNAFFTNTFEQEKATDIGVIIDAREQTNLTVGSFSLFEYSIRAAYSLLDLFLNARNRVSMLIYGRYITKLYPGYGKYQLHKALDILIKATTGTNFALSTLQYIPTRLFPAKSQIFYIGHVEQKDAQWLTLLKSRGYNVIVLNPDPTGLLYESFLNNVRYRDINEKDRRLALIERQIQSNNLIRKGIYSIDWDIRFPITTVIEKFSYSYKRFQ